MSGGQVLAARARRSRTASNKPAMFDSLSLRACLLVVKRLKANTPRYRTDFHASPAADNVTNSGTLRTPCTQSADCVEGGGLVVIFRKSAVFAARAWNSFGVPAGDRPAISPISHSCLIS